MSTGTCALVRPMKRSTSADGKALLEASAAMPMLSLSNTVKGTQEHGQLMVVDIVQCGLLTRRILRKEGLDGFHLGRRQPTRHLRELVGAPLGMVGLQTFIAHESNGDALEQLAAQRIGEVEHCRANKNMVRAGSCD